MQSMDVDAELTSLSAIVWSVQRARNDPRSRADDHCRVCEEPSSNQRVVLKFKPDKETLCSIDALNDDEQLHSTDMSLQD
jgi:hypothetical protein